MLAVVPFASFPAVAAKAQQGLRAWTGVGDHVVLACILERGGHINSAGRYLRDLTRRTKSGEVAIGPMLMALVRQNGPRSG